ncbi:hypothetical protein BDFG_08566, partial [Blastomyces dermatitidis ATCC 26199]
MYILFSIAFSIGLYYPAIILSAGSTTNGVQSTLCGVVYSPQFLFCQAFAREFRPQAPPAPRAPATSRNCQVRQGGESDMPKYETYDFEMIESDCSVEDVREEISFDSIREA